MTKWGAALPRAINDTRCLLTNASLDPRQQWERAVALAYRSAGVRFTSAPRTYGLIRTYALGCISVTRIEADQRAGSVDAHADKDSPISFSMLLEGEASFRFRSGSVSLRKGDGILLGAGEEMDFECSAARLISFDVPRYVLENANVSLGELNGWRADCSSQWGQVLHQSLVAMWGMEEGIVDYRSTLEAQLLSSFSMLICNMEKAHCDKRTQMAYKLRRSIRELFYNRAITASKLATHHDISVRQMHSCLAALGTTYGQELLSARLACAERYLSDRRHTHMSVAEIAFQSGFVDASHLRRRLRDRHGLSPSEFRRLFGLLQPQHSEQ